MASPFLPLTSAGASRASACVNIRGHLSLAIIGRSGTIAPGPINEVQVMSITIAGVVKNGVVVSNTPLPEGAQVEIRLNSVPASVPPSGLTPGELRRLPREQRQAILATAAEIAEEDYRSDKELTGFEAFSEEELDDDESDAH